VRSTSSAAAAPSSRKKKIARSVATRLDLRRRVELIWPRRSASGWLRADLSAFSRAAAVDRPAERRAAWGDGLALLVCCWVPVLLTLVRFVTTAREHAFALDFHHYYWLSGHYVLHGRSPFPPPTPDAVLLTHIYPAGPYPAPVPVFFAPFGLLPVQLAEVIFTAILIAALFYALRAVGVRDWRCYGAAFLWAPVAFAIQTANLTLLLLLGLAILWRLRHRIVGPAVVLGVLISLKLFLWPLAVWLVATRRYAAAAWSLVVAAAITLGTWAMLGFAGFQDYPHVARIFGRYYESSSYTPFSFLVHLGLPNAWARACGLALGVAALVAVVVTARRNRSETTSFTLAVATALLLTPIVWLHYFALLLVPLALLSPTFSVVWVLPVILWACPVGGQTSTWKYAFPLAVFAVVLLLAQRIRHQPASAERWQPRPWAFRALAAVDRTASRP
jgi:hypothetical protein